MRAYGNNRHDATRDWRRVPQAIGAAAFASAAPINLGQSFTISAMVYLPSYGTALNLWYVPSGAGIRWQITSTGTLSLSNASDAAQVSADKVPLGWSHMAVSFDAATRTTKFSVDGELVHSVAMAGATAWTFPAATTGLWPLGSRVVRLQAWRSVLTQDQVRADFYLWGAPPADVIFPLNNTAASVSSHAGFDGGVALGNASLTNAVWTDQTPGRPPRLVNKPYGYSIKADSNGNGSAAQAIIFNQVMPTALQAMRGAQQVLLACRIKFLGAQTSSFRSLTIGLTGAAAGPSMRWDCTTVAGQILLTMSGKVVSTTGTSIAVQSANIASQLIGKWRHAAILLDYGTKTCTLYLDGLPILTDTTSMADGTAGAGLTMASGYHPEAFDGAEILTGLAINSSATNGLACNTLQTDHLLAYSMTSGAITSDHVRELALSGAAPSGTIWRLTMNEGLGVTTVDAVSGQTVYISRDGTSVSTQWRGDVS